MTRERLRTWRPLISIGMLVLFVWLPLAELSHLIGVYMLAVVPPSVESIAPLPVPEAVTVVLVGVDTKDMTEPKSSVRSDSIIVGTIDPYTVSVRLLSIPRDTYVNIPGRGMDKINHAFAFGGGTRRNTGIWLTKETIIEFLGIQTIDYYFIIDMVSVPRLIDAIGGVEVDVDVSDPRLPDKGRHRLTGKEALVYARWRYDHMGDINRVKRQQKLLLAIFQQLKTASPRDVALNPDMLRFALSEIRTDVSLGDALFYAARLQAMTVEDIEFYQVPGRFMNLNGISYWDPDLDALQPIIDKVFHWDENPKDMTRLQTVYAHRFSIATLGRCLDEYHCPATS